MRTHEKRGRGLSPVMIRSLGVLAIALIAMTTSPETSTGIQNCSQCAYFAQSDCLSESVCKVRHKNKCMPVNVSPFCQQNCRYEWLCKGTECQNPGEDPGVRLECNRALQL